MKGDYSRDTFDPFKHFSQVLMQQGRVQLDADWNEQGSIWLHYLRTLAVDLIGQHGGPADNLGFEITTQVRAGEKSLGIGFGRYYVDGILCENEEPRRIEGMELRLARSLLDYFNQPDYPLIDPASSSHDRLSPAAFFVYLDVWERHITYLEDDSIREVALGGPDTAARTKTVWQVKVKPLVALADLSQVKVEQITCDSPPLVEVMRNLKNLVQPANRGRMAARAQVPEDTDDTNVCIVSPEAAYRGAENQLYRVEIHDGGKPWDGKSDKTDAATFKWSRDAVAFPIQSLSGKTVMLENLGRDDRFGLEVGDWVEVADDNYVLLGKAEPLLRVEAIDRIDMQVTLSAAPKYGNDPNKHPLLRRWDQQPGDPAIGGLDLLSNGAAVVLGNDTAWLNLEDGIQIQFRSGAEYRTGDYWLIPARTVTGDIEWPSTAEGPLALAPRGIDHHLAPLAVVDPEAGQVTDLRHSIAPIGSCCPKIEVLPPKVLPPTLMTSLIITFTARVTGRTSDLKYRWSVIGGKISDTDKTTAVINVSPDGKSTAVIALVAVEGLPAGCPNSAMGAFVPVNEPR
jgi:hypothetical protein